ncbi:CASP-like protein 1C1 isoform X1 [Malania oleifera]|uniref:CASP-like protein 1C1 isoform X1 n=1 Tax=Malania oleifera TaxID=397392 RepID=UPI0025ADC6E8|nr:CASP-like protein 1C1 isoform X1 [Malania oleifera]
MNAPPRMICILVLRFLAFSTTLSAAIVMATSNETLSFFTNSVEISYSNSTAYKYFVIANGIVCGYSFLVLLLPSDSLLWRLVVALDGGNNQWISVAARPSHLMESMVMVRTRLHI